MKFILLGLEKGFNILLLLKWHTPEKKIAIPEVGGIQGCVVLFCGKKLKFLFLFGIDFMQSEFILWLWMQ